MVDLLVGVDGRKSAFSKKPQYPTEFVCKKVINLYFCPSYKNPERSLDILRNNFIIGGAAYEAEYYTTPIFVLLITTRLLGCTNTHNLNQNEQNSGYASYFLRIY